MVHFGVKPKIILLHGNHPDISNWPIGLEQLTFPEGTNFFSRGGKMRELLHDLPSREPVIIHDTFIAQMSSKVRNRLTIQKRKENLRNVLSLYATTPKYLFEGYWRGVTPEHKISLGEWPFYFKKHIPVFFAEFISCHMVDMVIGNSNEVIEGVQKYYKLPSERTKFISAEIDTDFFCPGPSKRKELNLPDDKKIILYVGHFQRIKGVDILLKTFDQYYSRDPRACLVMIGDIADTGKFWFKELLMHLSCKDAIEIRGRVSRNILRDYYRSCDVFVTPTYNEGSPRVVKEALACAIPVVSSNISGILAIDPNQESILMSSSFKPEEFSELIGRVVAEKNFRINRINAGLKCVQQLAPIKVAERYANLYKSLF